MGGGGAARAASLQRGQKGDRRVVVLPSSSTSSASGTMIMGSVRLGGHRERRRRERGQPSKLRSMRTCTDVRRGRAPRRVVVRGGRAARVFQRSREGRPRGHGGRGETPGASAGTSSISLYRHHFWSVDEPDALHPPRPDSFLRRATPTP
jgi:hypothetical protein